MQNQKEENALVSQRQQCCDIKGYILKAKITFVFICIISIVFVLQLLLDIGSGSGFLYISPQQLVNLGGNFPILVIKGQVHRLVIAAFLHVGVFHWLMNSLALFLFCAQVEPMCAAKLYIPVLVLGAIQGSLMFDLWCKIKGQWRTVAVGASTCICAVIGLFLAELILMKERGQEIRRVKWSALFMLFYMLYSVIVSSMMPGVDLLGHIGGFLSGLLIGFTVLSWGNPDLKSYQVGGGISYAIFSVILCAIWI